MAMIFEGIDVLARLDRKAGTMTRFQKITILVSLDGKVKRFTITKAGLFGYHAATAVNNMVHSQYGKTASSAAIKLANGLITMDGRVMPLISLEAALDSKRAA